MKKTILIGLMAVMLATPCFAQEIEPAGIFSLHGTLWQALPTGLQILPSPSLVPLDWEFGFYGGKVHPYSTSFYIDMLVCSIFWAMHTGAGGGFYTQYFGILQPIGIGIVVEYSAAPFPQKPLTVGLVIKVSDNWTPPEVE